MLSKYLKGILRFPDVNQSGGASASGDNSGEQSNQTDVKQEGESSASEQKPTDGAKPTLESVIQDTFKAHQATVEQEEDASGIRKSNETQAEEGEKGEEDKVEDSETQDEKGEEKKGEEETVEEGKPVPYDRFVEVNTKAKQYEEKLQVVEPLASAQQSVIDYCNNNNISSEEYVNWMDIAALAKSDPVAAMEKLGPIVKQLQAFTGDELPADLQAAVDNGDITKDYAKRIAKAENQTKVGQQRVQRMQQSTVQQQEQQYVQVMQNTVSKWIDSKRASDPDFAPKSKESDTHGKFEFFMNEFAAQTKAQAQSVKSPQDLVKIAEKCLATVNAALKGMSPKIKSTKHVSSTTTSTSKNGAPKTVQEAMAQAAAKHGISMPTK